MLLAPNVDIEVCGPYKQRILCFKWRMTITVITRQFGLQTSDLAC